MVLSAVAARRKPPIFAIVAACFGIALTTVCLDRASANAETGKVMGTGVYAMICDGNTGSSLAVTSPSSDIVVSQPQLTITGTVSNATQIEERVNGQYNGSIPLNPATTSFQTVVTLSRGTSTIELTAIDACGVTDGNDTIVITYEPPVTSPSGGGTSTGGNGSNTENSSGGVGVGQPVDPLGSVEITQLNGFDRFWARIARSLDFDRASSDAAWKSPIRASFLVMGIGLMVLASYIAGWWLSLRTRRLGSIVYTRETKSKGHVSKRKIVLGLRALGLVLIVLTFVI